MTCARKPYHCDKKKPSHTDIDTEKQPYENVSTLTSTNGFDVIESFESSFADKQVIPKSLEIMWLKKAVARYSTELDPLPFDKLTLRFDIEIDQYVIDTLAEFMKQLYQERQLSLVNKRVSIVGKDISIDGSNGTKTAEKAYLEYIQTKADDMVYSCTA